MKKSFLALSLLTTSSLLADCCCEPEEFCDYCEMEETIDYCEPNETIDCVCYTPAFYDLDCDCGLIFDVEFLYWYARETNLAYAVKFAMLPEIDPPTNFNPNPSELAFPSSYRHLKANWDPGGRVGIGFNSSCDGWDYYFNWTYIHNKSSSSTSAEFAGDIPETAESGVLDLWQNTGLNPIYDKVSATWRLNFNQVDFELGRKYWLSPCFNLRPYAGLRGVWTRTNFNVKGALGPKEIANVFTKESVKDKFKNTNWGAGLLAGLQPTWYFCSGFGLYGNIDGALLWGEFVGKKKNRYIDSLTVSNTVGSSIDISNKSKEEFYSLKTLLDLGIGLRLEGSLRSNRCRAALDLGWEHHIWFDHGLRHKPIASFTDGNFEYFANTVDIESNLVYGGLVARLRFDF